MFLILAWGCSCRLYAQVTLTAGEGSGLPGSSNNPVEISLANPGNPVRAISVDVCDVDNYLDCTGCQPAGRTPAGFSCFYENLTNGCVRIIAINSGSPDPIPVGEGPVLKLTYTVSGRAPSSGCKDLDLEEALVLGEDAGGNPVELPVIAGSGLFCFVSCTTDANCSDGLFCNGVERCDTGSGNCRAGSYPCQTPPLFVCDEEMDLCLEGEAPLFLTLGEGSGLPGSSNNPVEISLTNPGDPVRAISVDVCDVDNYLDCTGCQPAGRTPAGFSCFYENLTNGCVRIIAINSGSPDPIPVGEGPVLELSYRVSRGAPSSGCRDLNPEGVSVLGEDAGGNPVELTVIAGKGSFCFYVCTSDADCDDGVFCNGEEQCEGICRAGTPPCGDDGFFCNGAEGCDEANNVCTHSGDPCAPASTCDEAQDICLIPCTDDEDCDDGLFCSGLETCGGGFCQPGTAPCPGTECNACQEESDSCFDPAGTRCGDDGNLCTDDVCDGSGGCVNLPNSASCNDGAFCNGTDTCSGGTCFLHAGDPCPSGSVCNESQDLCNCTQNADCDDGFFCNGVETCKTGVCDLLFQFPNDYPCRGQDCNEATDQCQPITITVEDGTGPPGSARGEVEVSLATSFSEVKGMQMEICDTDNYLTCSGCTTTERTAGFTCSSNEVNGCCRVSLVSFIGTLIEHGAGPIFTLAHRVSPSAPAGACRTLTPINVGVQDLIFQLAVTVQSGEFCFTACGDDGECDDGYFCSGVESCGTDGICHGGSPPDCGDGIDCTADSCLEGSRSCVHSPINSLCDDGVGCTDNRCDPLTGCRFEPDGALCSDGLFCNGPEQCDPFDDCRPGEPPCPETECNQCQEGTDSCYNPAGTPCSDDGNSCTGDTCSGSGSCIHTVISNGSPCEDGLYCTVGDFCAAGTCGAGSARDCSFLDDQCTAGVCDDTLDQCISRPRADGTVCNDGTFCNGSDTCSAGSCSQHSGNPCPPLVCSEPLDRCVNPGDEDGDGVLADGDSSGTAGDNFCSGGLTEGCDDNCPDLPNGPELGSCVKETSGVVIATGGDCTGDPACGDGHYCDRGQGDVSGNGIGDACECYADCNCDAKVDLSDLVIMKREFLSTGCGSNPCEADGNNDGSVNLADLVIMKNQFLRADCAGCSVP